MFDYIKSSFTLLQFDEKYFSIVFGNTLCAAILTWKDFAHAPPIRQFDEITSFL